MCKSTVTVNVDTEFRAPPECPRTGDVHCKVVRADCEIVDRWDHWVTFRVCLRLKLRVESCRCEDCLFVKEIVVTETIRVDGPWWVQRCDVKAAVCKCVVQCGRVHCNLTALVQFELKPKHHCWPEWHGGSDWHPKCNSHCHRDRDRKPNAHRQRDWERGDESGWTWHDDLSGSDRTVQVVLGRR